METLDRHTDMSPAALHKRVMEIDGKVRQYTHDIDAAVQRLNELVLNDVSQLLIDLYRAKTNA